MDNNDFLQNLSAKYECKMCHFISCNKTNFRNHLDTKKHKNSKIISNNNDFLQKNATFDCECGKSYKHKPNLYAHKKKCDYNNSSLIVQNDEAVNYYKEIINELMNQNKNLMDQNKKFIELTEKSVNTISNELQ